MSEKDKAQQTEEATPKRQEKMRKDGKLVRSQDIIAAAVLGTACLTLAATGGKMSEVIIRTGRRAFSLRDAHRPLEALIHTRDAVVIALGPFLAAAMGAALVAGLAQTRARFSLSDLMPKAERFSPGQQLMKMLPGKESAVEISKSALKMGLIGCIVWQVIESAMPSFIGMGASSLMSGAGVLVSVMGKLAQWGVAGLVVVAAFDYFLVKRKFDDDAKMSRQEVRDEHKEDQGDPLVKRRMRQMMRELGRSAQGNISEATVLVTNPTHLAVALRYDPSQDAAPIILAKAADDAALRMRREARKHGIPIVENKPFARAMYKSARIGDVVPAELFGPAAAVIAHVMRLRGGAPNEQAPS